MTRIGSLCSGYAGLDLAVQDVLGGAPVWFADPDTTAAAILAHHYPTTPNLGDITTARWADVEPVDILTGGYPCQPFSLLGHRKGTHDPRHLWPHLAAAVRRLRPAIVILENVPGHVSLGFPDVLADLAACGFDAEWLTVRASDVGAAHSRERLFVLAWLPDSAYLRRQRRRPSRHGRARPAHSRIAAPAPGIERTAGPDAGWGRYLLAVRRWERIHGRPAPAPTDHVGRLSPAFVEWLMGLDAGHVTAVPGLSRGAQLRALGNGVVPAQAVFAVRELLHRAGLAEQLGLAA